MTIQRLQGDVIVTVAGFDAGVALVGGLYDQRVIATAQIHVQVFEVAVGDATGNRLAGQNNVCTHTEAGNGAIGKRAPFPGRTAGVIEVQGINLFVFINQGITVDGTVVILKPGLGGIEGCRPIS